MSTLYLGTDLDSLANRLAAVQSSAPGDFFVPVTVAASNPYMAKWLRLSLARKQGVVINVQFKRLETAMWEMLRALDRRKHDLPVELLHGNCYRVMILSMLLDATAVWPDLDALRDPLEGDGG